VTLWRCGESSIFLRGTHHATFATPPAALLPLSHHLIAPAATFTLSSLRVPSRYQSADLHFARDIGGHWWRKSCCSIVCSRCGASPAARIIISPHGATRLGAVRSARRRIFVYLAAWKDVVDGHGGISSTSMITRARFSAWRRIICPFYTGRWCAEIMAASASALGATAAHHFCRVLARRGGNGQA